MIGNDGDAGSLGNIRREIEIVVTGSNYECLNSNDRFRGSFKSSFAKCPFRNSSILLPHRETCKTIFIDKSINSLILFYLLDLRIEQKII